MRLIGSTGRSARAAVGRRLALSSLLVVVLATAVAAPASALSVRRTFTTTVHVGLGSVAVTLTIYTNSTGTLNVTGHGLAAGVPYNESVYRGSCSAPKVVTALPGLASDGNGDVAFTTQLTLEAVLAVVGSSPSSIGYRFTSATTANCGVFGFPVATRIVIAKYAIDLPIVTQSRSAFPYCNVGIYGPEFGQPGETGVSLIYAHARKGMFLPLFLASKISAGKPMLGMTVYVYTSNNLRYAYKVQRVIPATKTWPTGDNGKNRLWIQTSTGPGNTSQKLFLIAYPVGVTRTTQAAAHPVPHPIVCK
jgi:hypothetical protein